MVRRRGQTFILEASKPAETSSSHSFPSHPVVVALAPCCLLSGLLVCGWSYRAMSGPGAEEAMGRLPFLRLPPRNPRLYNGPIALRPRRQGGRREGRG